MRETDEVKMRELEMPVYLFHQGTATKAYELLGAHPFRDGEKDGYVFGCGPQGKKSFP